MSSLGRVRESTHHERKDDEKCPARAGKRISPPRTERRRFSYLPQAGHLSSSLGAWSGDSPARQMLDSSRRRSARSGEIILLDPRWTSFVVVRRVVGRSSNSPQAGLLLSSFGACWGDYLGPLRLDISHHSSAHRVDIFSRAPGCRHVVDRLPSPERVRESLQHAPNDFERCPARGE